MTIDMLPDDALVEIFNFHINGQHWDPRQNAWRPLVRVCRRWRYLVFASPRHLNLRLVYYGLRPMSKMLDAWPVLPVILVSNEIPGHSKFDQRWENRVAALESEHYDRICEIIVSVVDSHWKKFAAAMQKSFPQLTHLHVWVCDAVPILPDSFLGGSAPRLRTLSLGGVPFPSIPRLLLSTNDLVTPHLEDIPHSGYFSPEAMATALTVMTRLESLDLKFHSPLSRPDPPSRPLPPSTRFVLPALTKLCFKGVYEYLEDLLARVDAPLLYDLFIIFFMDLNYDLPQLHRLICHAEEFKALNHATVLHFHSRTLITLIPKAGAVDCRTQLRLRIEGRVLDWQLSSLAQICCPSFPLVSTLEELEIREYDYLYWADDVENARWLELLRPFTSLKNLYLSHQIARFVCGALQELSGERATEVLPALRNIFVEGSSLQPVQEAMMPFVAARQLSGHPIVIERWKD
jgi:hypothetical protein